MCHLPGRFYLAYDIPGWVLSRVLMPFSRPSAMREGTASCASAVIDESATAIEGGCRRGPMGEKTREMAIGTCVCRSECFQMWKAYGKPVDGKEIQVQVFQRCHTSCAVEIMAGPCIWVPLRACLEKILRRKATSVFIAFCGWFRVGKSLFIFTYLR